MKKILIVIGMLVMFALAFAGAASSTNSTPGYSSSGVFTVAKWTGTAVAGDTGTVDYFDGATLDGTKLSDKDWWLTETVTTAITLGGGSPSYLTPTIYASIDGVTWYTVIVPTWVKTTTLTATSTSYCAGLISLRGVYAPYFKVRWSVVAAAGTATGSYLTAGVVKTVIYAK